MKEEQELKELQAFSIDLTMGKTKAQLKEEHSKDVLRKDIHLIAEILCANTKTENGVEFVIEGAHRESLMDELMKRIIKL